jgi:hypothetical protein
VLFPILIGVALAVTVGTSSADARVLHRTPGYRLASTKPAQQTLYKRQATRTCRAMPKWSWDVPLEVRAWKWPPYYRR